MGPEPYSNCLCYEGVFGIPYEVSSMIEGLGPLLAAAKSDHRTDSLLRSLGVMESSRIKGL